MYRLEPCDCGAYSGLIHKLRLGQDAPEKYESKPIFAELVKIARCPHVETTGWGKGGGYDHVALLINANLWDLLYSGLGLAQDVVRCLVCERFEKAHYQEPYRARMLAERLCFSCSLWQERLAHRELPHFVANGEFYQIRPEPRPGTPNHCLGFGGAKWIVVRDGKEIRTRNLFTCGEVPPHWRDQFPDTATLKQDKGGPSPAFFGNGGP